MKARKAMKDQALIQEVISQMSQDLAPTIPGIRKAMGSFWRRNILSVWNGPRVPLPVSLVRTSSPLPYLLSSHSSSTTISLLLHCTHRILVRISFKIHFRLLFFRCYYSLCGVLSKHQPRWCITGN
ncbi:hypothetical protein BKA70DRAFT_1304671 [Coprinopsis sp. MPI-PUGE-AT-0042]|nr:hypothetical protein BKA70DRAFT_1304671 [Coprinopsis sp. MPI-PUGE-AT-0042]